MKCDRCKIETDVLHAEGDPGTSWNPSGEIVGRFCYNCANDVQKENRKLRLYGDRGPAPDSVDYRRA